MNFPSLLRLVGCMPDVPLRFTERAKRYIAEQYAFHEGRFAVLSYCPTAESCERDEAGAPAFRIGEHCSLGFWSEKFPGEWCYNLDSRRIYVRPDCVERIRKHTIDLDFKKFRLGSGSGEIPLLVLV